MSRPLPGQARPAIGFPARSGTRGTTIWHAAGAKEELELGRGAVRCDRRRQRSGRGDRDLRPRQGGTESRSRRGRSQTCGRGRLQRPPLALRVPRPARPELLAGQFSPRSFHSRRRPSRSRTDSRAGRAIGMLGRTLPALRPQGTSKPGRSPTTRSPPTTAAPSS